MPFDVHLATKTARKCDAGRPAVSRVRSPRIRVNNSVNNSEMPPTALLGKEGGENSVPMTGDYWVLTDTP